MRSKKNSPPPLTPNNFGNWVMAIVSAAPALKPSRMVSLMKLTSELNRSSHASTHMQPTTKCGQRRNVGPAFRIALCHTRDRDADEHRDRGGRTDRELARRAEQRIEQAADQIAVNAILRRQSSERGVGERHRNRVGRKGHAGDRVVLQPLWPIGGKPLRRWKGRAPAADWSIALALARRFRFCRS